MKYHISGAFAGKDSAGDGKYGLFDNVTNAVRLDIDQPGNGIYSSTGALRVHDATLATGEVGAYDSSGRRNVSFIDGLTPVGTFAKNGSRNFVLV